MATEKNITMKQFNGTDYDTLYPKTKVEQVEGAYTQQQILANSTKTLYGLDATAVPDDVFSYLHNAVRKEIIMQHENDGTVSNVSIDLTSIDFRKRIFVEVDAGENESNVGFDIYFEKQADVVTADLRTMTASTKTSVTSLNQSAYAYKGRPIRFELIVTGIYTDGAPKYLQIDLRYDDQAKIFLANSRYGIPSLHLGSGRNPFKAGSKITVYAI